MLESSFQYYLSICSTQFLLPFSVAGGIRLGPLQQRGPRAFQTAAVFLPGCGLSSAHPQHFPLDIWEVVNEPVKLSAQSRTQGCRRPLQPEGRAGVPPSLLSTLSNIFMKFSDSLGTYNTPPPPDPSFFSYVLLFSYEVASWCSRDSLESNKPGFRPQSYHLQIYNSTSLRQFPCGSSGYKFLAFPFLYLSSLDLYLNARLCIVHTDVNLMSMSDNC